MLSIVATKLVLLNSWKLYLPYVIADPNHI